MPLKRTTTHTVRFSMRTKEPVSIGGTTVSISKQHELQGAEEVVIVFADTCTGPHYTREVVPL